MIEGAIHNPSGKIYVRFHDPIPRMVVVGGKPYVCEVRRGVSMLLVDEGEVPPLLGFLGGCCGGQKKVFSLASESAVNLWEHGER